MRARAGSVEFGHPVDVGAESGVGAEDEREDGGVVAEVDQRVGQRGGDVDHVSGAGVEGHHVVAGEDGEVSAEDGQDRFGGCRGIAGGGLPAGEVHAPTGTGSGRRGVPMCTIGVNASSAGVIGGCGCGIGAVVASMTVSSSGRSSMR